MARFDYRSGLKRLTLDQQKNKLSDLKDKLLINIGVCDSNTDQYLKEITYLETLISKKP